MDGTNWFKNAIIYQIFIDRFAGFNSTKNWDQPIFLGGNIKGIIEKITYLKNMGITTIWISPFYSTSAYHGYHVTDFFSVDSHFGTIDDLKNLIKIVYDNDMKIISDFIPNHCSKQHPIFKEAQSNKNSQYYNWFYFTNWPDEYLSFLSMTDIPKLNLNNKCAKKHIIDAALYWLSLGFDGFRLDHIIGPPHSFWKEFKFKIKSKYPNVVLIGEAWMMGIKLKELNTISIKNKYFKWIFQNISFDSLFKEYIGELDGVLDFKFQELIKRYNTNPKFNDKMLYNQIKQHYSKFPNNFYLPTFLDNHDMDRSLFYFKNDIEKLKNAIKIQFSIDQPIIIYYGTEAGLSQEKSIWDSKSHGDIQARQPMNWSDKDSKLYLFYKELIRKRLDKI